ncbi:NAD(P)H-binding protein [Rhodococcus sp. NPDC047139]|uniref:NmrA family NAD(P)-binding protein n=1 Tax=Rhodococcus sp. NPDC047139 TaxID=3155141 RepID=UPI0033C0DF90
MAILVTGATGNVGRLVVDELLRAGAPVVRALTVNPARAALPEGVEVAKGYVGRPESLDGVFDGIDTVYLAPVPAVAREVAVLARDAGVRRLVTLTGGPGTEWYGIEADVEASGLECTHLEPGEFMSNATIWAEQIRTTGRVVGAYPTAANAPIALEDIAAVAARALLDESHSGRTYELTGPELLTHPQIVHEIGRVLGRDVPFVEAPREEAEEALSRVMGEYAGWYLDGRAAFVDRPQLPTTAVADVLGRPATTFAQWAEKNAGLFR